MAPKHPYRRLTDHLFLVADALLLTVIADAVLIILRDLAHLPTAWIDPMTSFLLAMALGSMLGAEAAWLLHRRSFGSGGLWMLTAGLAVAAPAFVIAHGFALGSPDVGAGTGVLVAIQILGLTILMPPLVAVTADIVKRKSRHLDAVAIVRLAGLLAIAALITLRFLPETQAYPAAAHTDAMLGLSTIAGALAVGIGDAIRLFSDQRAQRRRDTAQAPAPTT